MNIQKYNHNEIEKKWRDKWEESKLYEKDLAKAKNPFFNLMMFPYPSAEGLHIGSVYTFSGVDTFGRFKQMSGREVFEPIGLDGFGIHSENFAIKIGEHIREVSKRTEKHFYDQMKNTGNMYDWSRTVETYKPDYYKWTQWLFLELYKAGLAYRKKSKVNWCPTCKTVLSDEQVIDGRCERTGDVVEKKDLEQWFFKITKYTDRLLKNLDWIDWSEDVKTGQKNWIGKKTGINITYKIEGIDEELVCFTTRPDTNFGATFIVLAPEHPFVDKLVNEEIKSSGKTLKEISAYRELVAQKSDIDRLAEGKKKTGVFTGYYAINNLNGKKIPVWISDFVLAGFGTGAVVGVPAHDMRDFQFAQEFNIEVKPVLKRTDLETFRSFLMGDKDISKEDLEEIGVIVHEESKEGRKLEIPKESFDAYKKLMRSKLAPGFWNEVIGEDIWFLFKDHNGKETEFVLNQNNWEEIASLCSEFSNDPVEKTGNLYLYLASNEWYTPVLVQEEDGVMINSEFLNGLPVHDAVEKMMDHIEENGWGERVVNYNLRDWCVSRQRYWGPPIPMVKLPKSEKLKVLIIHGTKGNSKGNWFGWLAEALKEEGIEAAVPDLPDSSEPDYQIRMKFLEEKYADFLTEDSIIVGHSSGAATALHLAEKYKLKQVIMVAPYIKAAEETFPGLVEDFGEKTAKAMFSYVNRPVDFKKVQNNVTQVISIFGGKDKYVTPDYLDFVSENLPDAVREIYPENAHFSSSDGTKELPQILNYISPEKWITVPESELPVLLPDIPKFEDILPDGSGKGPLEKQDSFVNASQFGSGAKRETDVSDPFVDSCWYFLRYPFVGNDKAPFEFVKRPMFGDEVFVDQKIIDTLKEVYNLLENANLHPMLLGSIMLTGLNGKPFTKINDIDFVFSKKEKALEGIDILLKNSFVITEENKEHFVLERDGVQIDMGIQDWDSYLGFKVKIFDQKMRIVDPKMMRKVYENKKEGWSQMKLDILDFWLEQRINKWFPVTYYIGGKEHTVLHLLYARFVTMVFNDLGLIDFEEPFAKFYGHGLITKDGAKMSKSKGNVINPDEYYDRFGADAVRLYLRFLGPFDQGGDWRDTGMSSMRKFVNKIWDIYQKFASDDIAFGNGDVSMSKLHITVKKVAQELNSLKFNTAVAKIMELLNWYKENEKLFNKEQTEEILKKLALMLAPMMPHISEELWEVINLQGDMKWKWSLKNSVHAQAWPDYDEKQLKSDKVVIAIQINGKLRGTVELERGATEEQVMNEITGDEKYDKYSVDKRKKLIYIKDKLINIVV